MHIQTRTLTALMMALVLVLPDGAWAGGDHHKGYRGGSHYGHTGKHHGYRHHGGYSRGYSSKYKYVTKYSYDDDNDGERLPVGGHAGRACPVSTLLRQA